MVNSIFSELRTKILSVSIYYGTQSNIRVKSYCRLNLIPASVFNLEHLDILRDSFEHPRKNLSSFEFAKTFRFQFGASRYITGLNRTSVYKFIVISICSELLVSILSVSIYYPIQSDIRVKSYCRLNFLRVSVFNLERLDKLQDSNGNPCIKLLSIQFSQSFGSKFWASRYITGLNRTSVYKFIVVSIGYELPFSIWSILIYYGTQVDIRV